MKKTIYMLVGGLLVAPLAIAQDAGAVAPPAEKPSPAPVAKAADAVPAPATAADIAADGAAAPGDDTADATGAPAPNPIEEADGGFLIKDASLNDIFQLLAKRGDKQYFHNNKLNTDEYKVTGHLNADTDPLTQMEELAFQYGLRMYVKGNTVYAMMTDQLEKLPAKEWTYSLRYLRPTDIEQIKALIQPMLTAGRGIVNFEPKTNTIIVIDTSHHIDMVDRLLRKIDRPKGQIVVEVKILNVNRGTGSYKGVDWSGTLGEEGLSINMIRSLNSVFGLGTDVISGAAAVVPGATMTETNGGNLILSPLQIQAVLRALEENGLVTKRSNPVVITEDNEKATISLIDRIPIITTTSTATTTGGNPTVTEEVRYKIDESDSTDPDSTRELGVTVTMTPSLLPDGTIRMKMRPRTAIVTGVVEGVEVNGNRNEYPIVVEGTLDFIARIPDGDSLLVGGFYKSEDTTESNQVPILGDIPVIRFFFKSEKTVNKKSSLVFCVTPTSYSPSSRSSNRRQTERLKASHVPFGGVEACYPERYSGK